MVAPPIAGLENESSLAGIGLGLLAGIAFGALTVAVRVGVLRSRDSTAGTLTLVAASALLPAALAAATLTPLEARALWPFFLTGAVVPGVAQILNVRAVRAAGASRTSLLLATAPLLSATLAVLLLGERITPGLAAGIVLVVLGGATLAWERQRPEDFRRVGALLALTTALLFALRDVAVRQLAIDDQAPALAAALATLLGGAALLLVTVAVTRGAREALAPLRRPSLAFVAAGSCLGLAITALYLGFERANVTHVAPMNATGALWTVLLAALVLGRREAIGAQLVLTTLLVVAGGVLIGLSR